MNILSHSIGSLDKKNQWPINIITTIYNKY